MESIPRKVLLIDSEMLIHLAVSQAYQDSGPYFITSFSAGEALNKMDIFSFDLFLLSLDLNDQDSMELLEIIDQRFPEAPVILMANNDTDYSHLIERIEATKKQGSWQLIEKPFNLDILTILIERSLYEHDQNKRQQLAHEQSRAEKRNYLRNPHVQSIQLFVDALDKAVEICQPVKATLTDISEGGLGLVTKIPLQLAQTVRLTDASMDKTGVVAWTVPMDDHICLAGIQFC
jgi:DNA-binding NtrC family response regulator